MRWMLASILVLAIASGAGADDLGQARVAAAKDNAIDHLLSDVESEPISPSITVGSFLDKTASRPRLRKLFERAQPIGGPRWLDDQTCQVLLTMQAAPLRQELERIATDNPKTTPVIADAIAGDLHGWDDRVFSAVGTSTARLDAIRPPPGAAGWTQASDEDIRRTVLAARQDAVNRLLDSIGPVPLADGKTVGDALAIGSVSETMANWLGNRPVTLVDFGQDHQVEVTLSVTAALLSAELRSALAQQPGIRPPADEKSWAAVTDAISRRLTSPVGRAALSPSTQPATVVFLPDQPPDWVDRQLDADGLAQDDNKLVAARAAEAVASAKLRQQVMDLHIPAGATLGRASDADPRLAAKIDRTLQRSSHLYSVDYRPDGTVAVRISFDLRDLWQALAFAP